MRYVAFVFALLFLGASVSPAPAQPGRARQGVQSGEVRSLDQILPQIRRDRPGSLADVQGPSAGPTGDPRYRLKWVTPDGRVLWLDTDARTGRVLGVEGDDRRPPPPPRGAPGAFRQPRGNFAPPVPNADAGPPNGPPPGFARERPTRFDPGPPPDFGRGRPGNVPLGPPQGFRQGPPPRLGGAPGPGEGPRGDFRFRGGR